MEHRSFESITVPGISQYKGNPVLNLPLNGKGFSFGLTKAKTILFYLHEIESFVQSAGTSVDIEADIDKAFPIETKSEFLQFIRTNGGIQPQTSRGETDRFLPQESGYFGLVAKKGLEPDRMVEKLVENGMLQEGSTPADLFETMNDELLRVKYRIAV